jgi:heavy metal sensor kinase
LFKTLRFRLAAWNAGVVLVTAIVTLVVLRQGVRWALLHEMDQELLDDAREVALAMEGVHSIALADLQTELTRKALGHRQQGWYVKLLDRSENVLWATPGARTLTPKLDPADEMIPGTSGTFRLVRHTLAKPFGEVTSIRVGATLKRIREDVASIDRWVILSALSVLLAAPLCGYWLAARAAQTIGEITNTASRLRPSHLEERLPIRGTGDELDQLASTINGMLDRIAAYLNTKRDFLANAAHELRTPLAAIRSSVEVALNEDRSPDEYEDLMVDLIDECTSLETLVNQLLLLSETEADLPRGKFESLDLKVLVEKSVDMFRGVAEARGINLRAGSIESAVVEGNRVHLRQVLNNLLDNAIKYTPSGGQISVTLAADHEHQQAALSVSDTGHGISAAEQRHIFERFYRAESARSRSVGAGVGGTGLGLSICQSVIHNHGGNIECQSDLEKGTTFCVKLPLINGKA